MKFVEKVVGKVNRRAILIAVMGAMVGAVLIAMPIGLIWPMPISIGFLEEIHAVLIGTELLQKISRS
ncbi:MAG: hypothetical protein WCE81_05185 [Halobacteriota archaeon]